MTNRVVLDAPRLERNGATTRAVADVDGRPWWFESDDVALDARPEAFASAVMPGVLESGFALHSQAGLSRRWCRGVVEIASVGHEWWGWGPAVIHSRRRREVPRPLRRLLPGRRGTTLAFSGGVDSFHALLCGSVPVDLLVTVHGFDILLTDPARMQAWERSFRDIVAAVLAPAGVMVTRQAFVPDDLDPRTSGWADLRDRYRAGQLDAAEFGFGRAPPRSSDLLLGRGIRDVGQPSALRRDAAASRRRCLHRRGDATHPALPVRRGHPAAPAAPLGVHRAR